VASVVPQMGKWCYVPDGTVLAEEVEELLRSDVVAIPSQYAPSK
jgi:hypothetical protein